MTTLDLSVAFPKTTPRNTQILYVRILLLCLSGQSFLSDYIEEMGALFKQPYLLSTKMFLCELRNEIISIRMFGLAKWCDFFSILCNGYVVVVVVRKACVVEGRTSRINIMGLDFREHHNSD